MACPYCGGLVHPIAGRCKHCKQDLVEHRGRLGAAGAPLPALAPFAGVPGARLVSMPAVEALAAAERNRGLLRSWTFWVILLAVGAMIAALVLLLLPQHASPVRRGQAPLDNDRMDTDTLPRSKPEADPWNGPAPSAPAPADSGSGAGASGTVDPADLGARVPDLPASAAEDDDDAVADPLDPSARLADPFADPVDPDPDLGATGGRAPRPEEQFFLEVIHRLCRRMATCGSIDPVMQSVCANVPTRAPAGASRCYTPSAAAACLRAIDAMPCSGRISMSFLQHMPACLSIFAC